MYVLEIKRFALITITLSLLTACAPVVSVINRYIDWRESAAPYFLGYPLYSTDFYYDLGEWNTESSPEGKTSVSFGKLYFEADFSETGMLTSILDRQFTDTAVRATVIDESEQVREGAIGGFCRYQDYANSYFFVIGGVNDYAILLLKDGEYSELANWAESRRGFWGGDNEMEFSFICDQNELILVVDNVIVARAIDTTFSKGMIGLAAYPWNGNPVVFAIDELEVRDLSE